MKEPGLPELVAGSFTFHYSSYQQLGGIEKGRRSGQHQDAERQEAGHDPLQAGMDAEGDVDVLRWRRDPAGEQVQGGDAGQRRQPAAPGEAGPPRMAHADGQPADMGERRCEDEFPARGQVDGPQQVAQDQPEDADAVQRRPPRQDGDADQQAAEVAGPEQGARHAPPQPGDGVDGVERQRGRAQQQLRPSEK